MKMGGLWLWPLNRWCPDWYRRGVKPRRVAVKKKNKKEKGKKERRGDTRGARWRVARGTHPECPCVICPPGILVKSSRVFER